MIGSVAASSARQAVSAASRVVVKVGSSSLTTAAGGLDRSRLDALVDAVAARCAAGSQVVLVSSNQTGSLGGMRFLGQAKVVSPAGDILARTWAKAGLAVAELDVAAEVAMARRVLCHVDERRPESYVVRP